MKTFNYIYLILLTLICTIFSYIEKNFIEIFVYGLIGLCIINIDKLMFVIKTLRISKNGVEIQSNLNQSVDTLVSFNNIKNQNVNKNKKSSLKHLADLADNDYKNVIIDEENVIIKNLNGRKHTKEELIRSLAISNIEIVCEKIYKNIYKSQIKLLQIAQDKDILKDRNITRIYNIAKQEYKKIYKDYSKEQWLNFCTNTFKLLVKIKGKYELTDLGKAFLFYIYNMGYNIENKVG